MKRRITAAIVGVAVLAVVLFAIPLGIVVSRLVDEQAALRLERHAVLASRRVPTDFATSRDPVEFPSPSGVTFGLYDRSGTLVAGRGPQRGGTVVAVALANRVTQVEIGETRVVAIPIVDREVVVGATRASQPTTVADRRARNAVLLLIALGVGVIGVGAVLARFVAGRLARPVRRLRDQAVQLGEGDFAIEPRPTGIAEVDDAGTALATTSRRLQDLLRRERAFSADASHQLRTPLAALKANIETELQFPRPVPERVLREALDDIGRLEATIDDLLALARTTEVSPGSIELPPFLDRVRADWNGRFAVEGRPLAVLVPEDAPSIAGTEGLLRQALDVLLDNARTHGRGEVRVTVRFTDDSVTIAIADEGPGFSNGGEATLPDDSVNRTAGSGSGAGHGLGLTLARRLVQADRGRLVIARRAPNPVVEVTLPRRGP